MGSRAAIGLLLATVSACLAGCGSGQRGSPARAGGVPSDSGRVVFTQACGACHSLSGHNDPRQQGGDLLNFSATRTQMMQLAGEMPVPRPLSRSQLRAVVSFVMDAEQARHR